MLRTFIDLLTQKINNKYMKMRTGWLLTLLAASGIFMTACNKQVTDNLSNEESRIYITDYDSTAGFTSYKTYSISDSVTLIQDNHSGKQMTASDAAYIDAVKKYMSAKGYTLTDRSASPDLGINISRIYSTTTGVISYPDYYGGYGGYYDPYYWGYADYRYYTPYSYGVYSITEGAVSIDMLDLKNAAASNKIEVVWTGLIRGHGLTETSSADSQVKALFDQSPYLTTSN